MAIFASTTLGTGDPSRAMSIKALEARAQALAAAQSKQEMPTSLPSPWQGASLVMNQAADAFATKRADQAAAQRRQDLAGYIAKAGDNPTMADVGQITAADPDVGKTYMQEIAQRRAAASQVQAQKEAAAQKAESDKTYLGTQEEYLGKRPQTDQAKVEADVTAGRLTREQGDAAIKKLNAGSPAEQKLLDETQSQNIDLQSAVNQLNEAHAMLQQGVRPGGLVGEATQGIGKMLPGAAGSVGIDPELTRRTDRYNQIMAGEALKVVNSMKGASSDKDLQFAIKTINDPATSPANKEQQLKVLLAKANAHLAASSQTLQTLGGTPVKVQGSSGTEAPAAPAAAGGADPMEGRTIISPDGKSKMVRRNGKWEPM